MSSAKRVAVAGSKAPRRWMMEWRSPCRIRISDVSKSHIRQSSGLTIACHRSAIAPPAIPTQAKRSIPRRRLCQDAAWDSLRFHWCIDIDSHLFQGVRAFRKPVFSNEVSDVFQTKTNLRKSSFKTTEAQRPHSGKVFRNEHERLLLRDGPQKLDDVRMPQLGKERHFV